jgi:sugar phosphate isomerase/epimerase
LKRGAGLNRRRLLAATAAAGVLPWAVGLASDQTTEHYPFGIQLYTLRDDMPTDPDGVLRQLAGFGYSQIESFEGPLGMFWGRPPAAFGRFVADLGMDLVASHCDIRQNFEAKVDQAATAGMRYLVCPWIGPQPSMDDYLGYADTFNRCGELCRAVGLRFGYHNHHYTFLATEGVYPQDLLMQNTDPALVDFELDLFWLVAAGEVPEFWLKRYPGRFVLSHVKDRKADAPPDSRNASVSLGTGIIDFPAVLPMAYDTGMRYFFVEQESYAGTTPVESSRANAAYMRQFRFG